MSRQDYLKILGVARDASDDEIKKAYRSLAMKYHPDRHDEAGKKAAESKFKEINQAYEFLSNPEKTSAFQYKGTGTNQSYNPFKDIFDEMYRTSEDDYMFKPAWDQSAKTSRPTKQIITISLEEAYSGRQLKLSNGSIINVPAGCRVGAKFYIDSSIYQIDIQPHYKFKRSGDDLLVDVEISAIEAMLSAEAILTHLDSVILQFTIPAGIQNGQIVRLAGKGMKSPETDKFGDLMIRISITIPKSLTTEQQDLLKSIPHRKEFNI